MSEFEVYSITGMNNDNTAIIVNPVTEDLVANTPYFIKAKTTGDKVIKVEDATLTVPQAYKETYGNYTLYGTYTSMAIADDSEYVLSNGQWVQMKNANSPILSAFRVYLTAPNGAANALSITRGETGIEELSTVNDQQSTVIYDLTGRKVETMDKGIYIVNGRKVVIK